MLCATFGRNNNNNKAASPAAAQTCADLLIHRPYAEVFTLYVSLDRAPNILKRALLRANCKQCLIAELIGHASVPLSKTGKQFYR